MKERKNTVKLWKIPICVIVLILVIVIGYVAFVFLTYSRIEDNQQIDTDGNADDVANAGEEYTVTTYNVGFGAYTDDYTFFMDEGEESRARSRESVIECITQTALEALSHDPDISLFQEVDTGSTRSFQVEQRDLINEIFAKEGKTDNVFATNYHSAYLVYPIKEPIGKSNSGLLTESKFDITTSTRRSLPIATGFKKILDLDRCYCISRIPVSNGKELIVINLHLSAYGTDAAQGNAQLSMLFEDMEKEYAKGNYVLCGGDFNHDFTVTSKEYFNPGTDKTYTWCEPFPDEIIPEGFKKCIDYDGGEMIPTTRYTNIPYGDDSFTVILDGFIVSDNITVNSVENIDCAFKYTDHNPVVMKFVLND